MIDRETYRGPRIGKFWSRASSQNKLFDVVGAAEEEFWRYSLESIDDPSIRLSQAARLKAHHRSSGSSEFLAYWDSEL